MASAGTSEIVEVGDELDLLHNFSRTNQLRIKLRAKEVNSPHDFNRLIDAMDLRASPRVLEPSCDASKKPVKTGMSRASWNGISESPSLKQALRRLCISHASEVAAIKRSSKLIGSSSISDSETIERLYSSVMVEARKPGLLLEKETKNSQGEATQVSESQAKLSWRSSLSSNHSAVWALKNAKMRRTQDLISAEHVKTGNSKASRPSVSPQLIKPASLNNARSINKGKQESVPAFGNSSRLNKFSEVGSLPSKTKLTLSKAILPTSSRKNHDATISTKNNRDGASKAHFSFNSCNDSVNIALEVNVSREKGESSQSSQSSLGDYSSSASISEESNSGSSSNCKRPHMSKDVRWASIQHLGKKWEV